MSKKKKKKAPAKRTARQEKLYSNLLKVTCSFILGKKYKCTSKQDLIDRLQIHPEHLELFESVLATLEAEGKLHFHSHKEKEEKKTLHLERGEKVIRGSLIVHPRGFGFVNQPSPNQDIFIPKVYMNGALDGDIVDVAVDTTSISQKGPEGRILEIVTRKRTQLVGTVTSVSGKEIHLYSPLLSEHHDIHIGMNTGLKAGDRVLLNIESWGSKEKPTIATLAEKIGHVRDAQNDLPFIIKASNLSVDFPPEVLAEAETKGKKVLAKDMKDRMDLRSLETFTIDPDTAKDFDDALSLEKTSSGYKLGVHIADVSYYVQEGSALDIEAKKRCNSTYFPRYCIPMLPRELSECLCSLRPHVNRLTVSVFFDVDKMGEIKSWNIVRSVIKSSKRFTYGEVKEILDGKKKSPFLSKLRLMEKVCKLFQKKRHERGSVQLYLPELVVKINEEGEPTETAVIEYDITHQIVEEFMLKANEIVAIELSRRGKDLSYRVHEEPSSESLHDFSILVSAFGYDLPATPTPQDIQKLFLEIEGTAQAPFLSVCYIRSMRLACYSPDNIGHYGLSLEHYCHFTSPIRRYVDTIIHRLLFEKGPQREEIEQICDLASEKERSSARAESALIMIKKLRLLHAWHKKSPNKQYEAIITRVKPFGITFDVSELMLEGFLHVSELEDDYYVFEEESSQLIGRYEGITYCSGQKISVQCSHVDLLLQEASWEVYPS